MSKELPILRFIGGYSLFLVIFGTIGNICSILVCLRKTLRNVPTFVFYAFMLSCDTVGLYLWNFDHFLLVYYGYELESFGFDACKLVAILQTFTFQSSAWLLTTMSLERTLSVKIKTWRTRLFNSKYSCIASSIVCLIILVISIIFGSLISQTDESNQPYNLSCYDLPIYVDFMMEHSVLYCFVPLIIMLCCNGMLIYQLLSLNKERLGKIYNKKQRSGIISIVSLTLFFTICIFPSSFTSAFYYNELYTTDIGLTIIYLLDAIAYSFHSFNFIVLLISNKQFRKQLVSSIKFEKIKSKIGLLTNHNRVSNTIIDRTNHY